MLALTDGSSPLVRGGRGSPLVQRRRWRLIPARAGRTLASGRRLLRWQAHPRSCGADAIREIRELWRVGSSPLVRGGLRATLDRYRALGLIPARAGRTAE